MSELLLGIDVGTTFVKAAVVTPDGVERAHGLPPARRQARRRHGSGNRYLDNLYEPFGLCVELDGDVAHPAEGRWRDTRRDNANLAQGARTLRYGWPDVTEYRCRTAAEIAEILRSQGWTGTLRRCGPGAGRGPRARSGTRKVAPPVHRVPRDQTRIRRGPSLGRPGVRRPARLLL